jgi:uncharacterized protein YtpQ (UPF0354 family)
MSRLAEGWGIFMLRHLIVLCAVLIAGPAVAQSSPSSGKLLTPRAFTDAFATAAQAAMPSAKITVVGDLELETRLADGNSLTNDLHNAYQLYQADPAHLQDVIAQRVRGWAEAVRLSNAPPPIDRSRIVPVIKPARWLAGAQKIQAQSEIKPTPEMLSEPLNSELIVVYAEDNPQSLRFLTTHDDVGDRAKLRNLALGNLHRMLSKIDMHPMSDGVFVVEAGGTYEASLLLADQIWTSGQFKVDGDIVVAVPVRDALLVTGSHNSVGLTHMRAFAAAHAAEPYGLTPVLLVYRDGQFVPFDGK